MHSKCLSNADPTANPEKNIYILTPTVCHMYNRTKNTCTEE